MESPVASASESSAVEQTTSPDDSVQLLSTETVHSGKIHASLYRDYCKSACGWPGIAMLIVCFCAFSAINNTTQLWLSKWIAEPHDSAAASTAAKRYGMLALGAVLVSLLAAAVAFVGFAKGAGRLHNMAADRMIRAPMSWIDSNPAGRILNRFSRDMGVLDDSLPFTLYEFLQSAAGLVGTLILICSINPYLLLVSVALTLVFVKLRKYYLNASRVVKRIESSTRSPVYALLTECLEGAPVIRAFGRVEVFTKQFFEVLDANAIACFNMYAISRWLGYWMDVLCVGLLAGAVAACIPLRQAIGPEMVGLTLSQVLALVSNFQWCVRQSAEAENEMISVERMLEYARQIPAEEVDTSPGFTTSGWPSNGEMELQNLCMRYRDDLPSVLHDVSFKIPAGARVGIVGRSGSGKSSLFAAILRLADTQQVEDGTAVPNSSGVLLSGENTAKVSLTALRRSIGVIPQQPTLFAGSIRFNLDPFSEFTEEDCWNALRQVRLSEWATQRGGLHSELSDGGIEASCGQRQCLCLARAMMRKNRIILCDEATANVDSETDAAIRGTIASAFSDATIVTIAHRLETVLHCDVVVVMDAGRVQQLGPPAELSQVKGFFQDLLSASGIPTSA
jgi:ATP-binding cassette subfamily C (CFTR/MRP) protein 4